MFSLFKKNKNKLPNPTKSDGSKARVFVGVSGGVDSSVSAAVLRDAGFDVTGVFIETYHPEELGCKWRDDRLDAMRVCEQLGIPFLDLDLQEEYKRDVFDYMVDGYKKGETPNPDVFCNKYVKFGGFLQFALSNGADYIATGHYAQNQRSSLSTSNSRKSLYDLYTSFLSLLSPRNSSDFGRSEKELNQLVMGADNNKDQTYFLWTTPQEKLQKILFPIGHLEKSEVRKLAEKYNLHNHQKKDSQGICFLGKVNMKEFLRQYIDEKTGSVLDVDGNIIGTHPGVLFFTLGERHGFTIDPKYKKPNMPKLFVISKDLEKNTVTVGPKSEMVKKAEDNKTLHISDINWISGEPKENKTYQARIRYRGTLLSCSLQKSDVGWQVEFLKTSPGSVAVGQSVVVYDGNQCMGGGIIV